MSPLSPVLLPRVNLFHASIFLHLLIVHSHRYPDSHTCSPHVQPIIGPPRSENARAIFAKHFSPPSGTSKRQTLRTKISTNPAKLAQLHKIELIKLRHRALPGDPKDKSVSVPPDQRLHIKVAHTDKAFWFRKVCLIEFLISLHDTTGPIQTLIAGKVLDLLATQLHFSFSDSTVSVYVARLPKSFNSRVSQSTCANS